MTSRRSSIYASVPDAPIGAGGLVVAVGASASARVDGFRASRGVNGRAPNHVGRGLNHDAVVAFAAPNDGVYVGINDGNDIRDGGVLSDSGDGVRVGSRIGLRFGRALVRGCVGISGAQTGIAPSYPHRTLVAAEPHAHQQHRQSSHRHLLSPPPNCARTQSRTTGQALPSGARAVGAGNFAWPGMSRSCHMTPGSANGVAYRSGNAGECAA